MTSSDQKSDQISGVSKESQTPPQAMAITPVYNFPITRTNPFFLNRHFEAPGVGINYTIQLFVIKGEAVCRACL